MANRTDAGKKFAADLLKAAPDGIRAALETTLNSTDGLAMINLLGDGALRQSEFSTQADALRAEKEALTTWRNQLEEYRVGLDAARDGTPTPVATPRADIAAPVAGTMTKDDVDKAVAAEINRREIFYATYTADVARLSGEHMQAFGQVLDARKILEHPQLAQLGVEGAYRDLYKTEYGARATAAATKEREDLKAAVRQELLAEMRTTGNQLPPLPGDTAIASPLDSLGADQKDFTVDAAVAFYRSGQASGSPVGAR